ncbi:pantoate--beta-alanine ligase [Pacificimonas sp. WHA3]|uniref:Pantothenate synthetase n=1 Tax=Pacificimonas pallii TaxID=2827236 RepID=A0ABS6SAG4_9SPHN|nr:pantoate--beta-alanine ligase [Pacificimonas pallii]MBV7255369.1 pantoate--beta-alanine ligase [Pacificimonas pallii]
MQTVQTVAALRAAVARWRGAGQTTALVPTMGALHAGHLSLVATAHAHADRVVASIFVNPTQFAAGEDLDSYPRQEAEDTAALRAAGCDLLFLPTAAEMYPEGYATTVRVADLPALLCGHSRPTHFDGVSTVVTKLLNQAQADYAIFGEKDWQQLAIIRRAARDLDIPTQIVGAPTVREADGLAMSSRNAYMTADERQAAAALPEALNAAASSIAGGTGIDAALAAARKTLTAAGFTVDYIEVRGAGDLRMLTVLDRPARLFAAAKMGRARLIDNIPIPV